jgi:hypothetical protein
MYEQRRRSPAKGCGRRKPVNSTVAEEAQATQVLADHHKADNLTHMDRRLFEPRALDGDAVVGHASDRHRSDQARVAAIALALTIDQGYPVRARPIPPSSDEIAGRPIDDNWRGRWRRSGRSQRRALSQELGDLVITTEKPNADLPASTKRTDEIPAAQRAHVTAADAEASEFTGCMMAAGAIDTE